MHSQSASFLPVTALLRSNEAGEAMNLFLVLI